MYINSCLSVKVLSSGANSLELLIVSVSHVCNHFKYCISVFYRPPSSCIDIFDNLCTVLQNLHPSVFNNFVLIGDFNVNYFCTQSYLYKYLMNSFIPFSLHQVVKDTTHNGPTGQPSLIDLVFLSNLSSFRFCNIISPLGNSDHNGLQLNLSWSTTMSNLSSQSRSIWNYSRADFSRARDLIDETNWDSLLSENLNVSLVCWQAKFLSIMELCIPRVVLPQRKNFHG